MKTNSIAIHLGLLATLLVSFLAPLAAQESGAPPLEQPSAPAATPSAPLPPSPVAPLNEPGRGNSAAPATDPTGSVINSAANDYVLTTSDTLEMSVFQEPDLTTRSKIGSDGSVQLPLIGDTKVAGLTVRAARELITKRYDARYLVNPQVYLNVIGYAQKKFTILGQVTKPGTYELPGGGTLSLLEAVGLAGGFTRSADRGKVLIQRNRETLRINAKKLSGEGDASFTVKAGDVITVGESIF